DRQRTRHGCANIVAVEHGRGIRLDLEIDADPTRYGKVERAHARYRPAALGRAGYAAQHQLGPVEAAASLDPGQNHAGYRAFQPRGIGGKVAVDERIGEGAAGVSPDLHRYRKVDD